ncbi:NAD(P)/FAD-dependent oxidoreductase [Nocardioides sp. URHA0020]|uniref:NAD(P)/FAD-dependent oxidoreductase n=1 Tax=Nocardioides sp. URHA0020 TaxID=1380392 RepID=UPI00048FEA79|nr:NAD(P)/FAD-dependent oxidoreductase [Nocardioides sp. URHA0020]
MRDLIVVGGGPVGLAVALGAARAGLDVAVVERRTGAIDKACGEGLMPGAITRLAALGVHPEGHPLTGIRYVDGDHRAEASFRSGVGLGVRRTTLHAALSEAAAAAGVVTLHRSVTHVDDAGDRVLVDGEPARYLVAADGLHSPVRRMLGLDQPRHRQRRYGQRCHFAAAPWTSFVEVHWAEVGEAYVTPVSEDQVGVAVLSESRRGFDDLLSCFPEIVDRLAGAAPTRVLGAGPLRQRSRRRSSGRVLLVGDAAGYVDALTGEGIAVGLAQASAAVAAVAADDPARYEASSRKLSRRHELLTQGLLGATAHPRLRRRLVPSAAALPWVFDSVVNQLAG